MITNNSQKIFLLNYYYVKKFIYFCTYKNVKLIKVMEEYIVSALKYRPLTFDSVVGQRALTSTLKNAIGTGKLAHAYLFCGPRGVGKTTCARIFARTINCLSPNAQGDPCGECESCKAFIEGRSMNIHELDAASNNSVDDIRELCRQVQIPPQIGKYKVFIIDEVHMLTTAAFNAFLKTLEEPPSYVIFILATTEKHKILPTILSRCQVYDFARMSIQNTIDHLMYVAQKEGHTAQPEALSLIAQKADGGMRDALSIYDQMISYCGGTLTLEKVSESLGMLSQDVYFNLVDNFLNKNVEASLLLYNEILTKGYEGGTFISGLASHIRDLLVAKNDSTLPLLETSETLKQRYKEQSSRCTKSFLYHVIHLCNECDNQYRTARNKRLQVEICLIECAQTNPDEPYSGRKPRRMIKPFFLQPVAVERKTIERSQHDSSSPSEMESNVSSTQSSQNVQRTIPEKKAFNIKALGPLLRPSKPSTPTIPQNQEGKINISVETLPLQQEKLNTTWFSFINQLPQEDTAIAQRMMTMRPTVINEGSFYITVDNKQVENYMLEMKQRLLPFMSRMMQNHNTQMEIRVADAIELQRKLSKPELYKSMATENKNLQRLVEMYKLVID